MIAVSIVSHGHGAMVERLVTQILSLREVSQVLVTLNIPENMQFKISERLSVVENAAPRGFGANHNIAFRRCEAPYFCVLNPDIELVENPFPALLNCMKNADVAVAAPLIFSRDGKIEDSARYFPTMSSLFSKAFGRSDGRWPANPVEQVVFPDWLAGMFMLYRATAFKALDGFDSEYFLYYEDVDICCRIREMGMRAVLCQSVHAVHDARRESHRRLKYLWWHLRSIVRYFYKNPRRLVG